MELKNKSVPVSDRASGPEYERLRNQVIELLTSLKDDNGVAPLSKVVKWEAAEQELQLPADRVGDLVVANRPTYGWVKEVTGDGQVFADSLKGGYKQAIIPESTDAMLTPFVIAGPGVKKNQRLAEPIRHIDQYPTIMTLLGKKIPDFAEGKPPGRGAGAVGTARRAVRSPGSLGRGRLTSRTGSTSSYLLGLRRHLNLHLALVKNLSADSRLSDLLTGAIVAPVNILWRQP